MNEVSENENQGGQTDGILREGPSSFYPRIKRTPGRPKGSKNKRKESDESAVSESAIAEGTNADDNDVLGTNSKYIHRKWQHTWVKPQFALSRDEASKLLSRFFRSKKGRTSLTHVIADGFNGINKLSNEALSKYLVKSNLLSRYPHEVIIGKK